VHPFFVGHVGAAIVLGAVAGWMVGVFGRLEASAYGAAVMGGGALVSALISAIGRGYNAPAGKVWLAATLGNPVFLAALFAAGYEWDCLIGRTFDLACIVPMGAVVFALACCLSPCVGLLWRRWSWRRSSRP
jgi:hypothetical protein